MSIAPIGPLVIYGAGGHGLVVAESAVAAGWKVVGFVDAGVATGTVIGPAHVIESNGQWGDDALAIVAIGDNSVRARLQMELSAQGRRIATIVHPSAWVSPSATVGVGVYIGPRAIINGEAIIGDGVIINSGAIVEHHNHVGPFAHIAPGATMAGRVHVGRGTLVGLNASVLPGVTIGSGCAVGAGAVVIKDVLEGKTVVGCPARVVR